MIKEDINEEWKDIVGFVGIYKVSNKGRFCRVLKNGKERELIPYLCSNGYLHISLQSKDLRKVYRAHRVIAKHFIPNPNNLPQVNHLNRIKTDNRVENLEWCSGEENIDHYRGMIRKNIKGKIKELKETEQYKEIQNTLCTLIEKTKVFIRDNKTYPYEELNIDNKEDLILSQMNFKLYCFGEDYLKSVKSK